MDRRQSSEGVSNASAARSRLIDDAHVCLINALDGLRAVDDELERLATMQQRVAMTAGGFTLDI